ncbi:RelA/SpoT domain-containing protein [Evansella clarkii]|uniref:RelA/SpoT domain-containing protein n=1 Tax=Evansella clarkii TaxID=79879 RepID=UPI000B442E23|nr:GTP pyrophosphokinase [Evansella clarkii]
MNQEQFLKKFNLPGDALSENGIQWDLLMEIFDDYAKIRDELKAQANGIAETMREHGKVQYVKSRVKDPWHLIAKLVRKTPDRQKKHNNSDFQFTVENYLNEITDLIGIRAIHLFKEDWEEIHNYIKDKWDTIEETANIRLGDSEETYQEKGVGVTRRDSGYRSVHYLIKFKLQKVPAELQVRTIFEEGYGEIDHQMRYPHNNVPAVLNANLMILNRVAGTADEMASFLQNLKNGLKAYDNEIESLKEKVKELETGDQEKKDTILSDLNEFQGTVFKGVLSGDLLGSMSIIKDSFERLPKIEIPEISLPTLYSHQPEVDEDEGEEEDIEEEKE